MDFLTWLALIYGVSFLICIADDLAYFSLRDGNVPSGLSLKWYVLPLINTLAAAVKVGIWVLAILQAVNYYWKNR